MRRAARCGACAASCTSRRRATRWPPAKTPQCRPGKYTAKFWLTLQCGGYRRERLGSVSVRGSGKLADRVLDCTRIEKEQSGSPLALDFALTSPTALTLSVTYDQGGVALDRMDIKRRKTPP